MRAAYRAYRAEKFRSTFGFERIFRPIWHRFVSAAHDKNERPVGAIRFLGLWDTVAAYGLPVEEMTRGISRYLFPLELPDRRLNQKIQRACHALSLDDERTTFHPVLWDESGEPASAAGERLVRGERISQVWFAGVHANVGGGYPDDSLAHVSLSWMMAEAAACGLRFKCQPGADPDAIVHAKSAQDKDGRLYDSRSGLGGYYRYGPRKVADLCNMTLSDDPRDKVQIKKPKIHESVFERIKVRAHLYAPIGLPRDYEVVTGDGRILPADRHRYESEAFVEARCDAQELAWNVVWRRRVIYFLTVFASVYLASYPLYHRTSPPEEFMTPLRQVSDAIRIAGSFLPGFADAWLNAYARDPGWFLLVSAIVAYLMSVGSGFGQQVTDRMNSIWKIVFGESAAWAPPAAPQSSRSILRLIVLALALCAVIYQLLPVTPDLQFYPWLAWLENGFKRYSAFPVWGIAAVFLVAVLLPANWIFKLRSSPPYKKGLSDLKLRQAPIFFAIAFLYLGLMFASHLWFTAEDAFGLACTESPNPAELRYCSLPTLAMCDDRRRPTCENTRVRPSCTQGTPVCGGGSIAACSMGSPTCSSGTVACDAQRRIVCQNGDAQPICQQGVAACGSGNVPICSSGPSVCPRPCTDDVITLSIPFDTSNVCFGTNVKLERWGTYRLTITPRENRWYAGVTAQDHWYSLPTIGTNAGGFRISELRSPLKKTVMLFLWPLKRSFIRPWFAVVARIGATGNDEDFLDPDEDSGSAKKVVLQEKIKPRRDGELFLYVNNAVIAGTILKNQVGYFDFFYRLSKGTADVKIERVRN